jgi:alkaline phosphatase D
MKKLLLLLLTSALFFGCKKDITDTGKQITKVAFGSCTYQFIPDKKIFRLIADENPDLFIYGGDNIYGDFFALAPGTPEYMEGCYKQLFESPDFMYLRDRVPILPIWDDHDFGQNDGTVNNPVKKEAKQIFFERWNIPANSPRANRPDGGIYDSYMYGDDAHRVQIILMDWRWNHTNYKVGGPIGAISGYDTIMDPNATFLGADQWAWLKEQFLKPAKLRLILASTQFCASKNGSENWAVFPLEKQKMFDLIKETQVNDLIFMSGDVHYGDLNMIQQPGMYPIYDVTSSGITHNEASASPSDYRVADPMVERNYGMIDIDWDANTVTLNVKSHSGVAKISKTLNLDDLKF